MDCVRASGEQPTSSEIAAAMLSSSMSSWSSSSTGRERSTSGLTPAAIISETHECLGLVDPDSSFTFFRAFAPWNVLRGRG